MLRPMLSGFWKKERPPEPDVKADGERAAVTPPSTLET
jgi:hypothetical protein